MKNFYYEVILQIRGNYTDEVLEFIDNRLNKFQGRNLYRAEEVKGGIDYYISSKNIAKKIATILKKQYHAKLVRSYKLRTRIDSRNIYKMTISVRI